MLDEITFAQLFRLKGVGSEKRESFGLAVSAMAPKGLARSVSCDMSLECCAYRGLLGLSAFDSALVFFIGVVDFMGPLGAPRLAARLRMTGRVGFRVGSALTDLVETLREVTVMEDVLPVSVVIDLCTPSPDESDDTWERLFADP